MTEIGFSDISDENAGVLFVRKYRNNMKTYYKFYDVDLHRDISKKLGVWLDDNIQTYNKENVIENYNPGLDDNDSNVELIELEAVDTWAEFQKNILLPEKKIEDLTEISNGLAGYIIYVKTDGGYTGH